MCIDKIRRGFFRRNLLALEALRQQCEKKGEKKKLRSMLEMDSMTFVSLESVVQNQDIQKSSSARIEDIDGTPIKLTSLQRSLLRKGGLDIAREAYQKGSVATFSLLQPAYMKQAHHDPSKLLHGVWTMRVHSAVAKSTFAIYLNPILPSNLNRTGKPIWEFANR
jgi:hypothetical protein